MPFRLQNTQQLRGFGDEIQSVYFRKGGDNARFNGYMGHQYNMSRLAILLDSSEYRMRC
jgi:hypothetical protein